MHQTSSPRPIDRDIRGLVCHLQVLLVILLVPVKKVGNRFA